jgi:zinc/manganese transport system substrate-binding protein
MKILKWASAILFVVSANSALAGLKVFACEPEWGALAKELGGSDVTVYTATNALQDPHHIQARPSLIAKMRQADLVVCTGAELEIGWLPVLLTESGNDRVQPGQPGYFEAAPCR